jgi:hypothetical protein
MNGLLKTNGTIGALMLGVGVILQPVQASEDPAPSADSSHIVALSKLAEPGANEAIDPDEAAHGVWHKHMAQIPTTGNGCFHASYPNLVWEKVDCMIVPPRSVHPLHGRPADGPPIMVAGDRDDTLVQAQGLISTAIGTFKTTGVTSETGAGVPKYDNQGNLGPNQYSVQLNTNGSSTNSHCDGHSECTVWQQFVYSTHYPNADSPAVILIEYQLLNYDKYGTVGCPTGFTQYIWDCVGNSPAVVVPEVPAKDLGNLSLTATALAGENDSLFMSYGTEVYYLNQPDSWLDISSLWTRAEFNVLGNGNASRADFNSGSSITVTITLLDGGAPAECVGHTGLTLESNNLNMGACKIIPGLAPAAQFTESN